MTDDTRLLSKPFAMGLGGVGLLVALLMALEIFLGVIPVEEYATAIYISFVALIVVLPLLLFMATRRSKFLAPALVWVHISAAFVLLFFGETYSPFTAAWSILILISSMYFGWKGFIASSASLVPPVIIYVLLFPEDTELYGGAVSYALLSGLVVVTTVFTAYTFFRVIKQSAKQTLEMVNAQRSEQLQVNRLNTLLNSISDAVMTLNRYGRVTSQNAAAQAFFDTNQSLVGREVDNLMNLKDDSDKDVSIRKLIDDIKSSTIRDDLSIGEGNEERHISLQMSRIYNTFNDSEEYGVVLIIRDITKQKTLEEEKDEFISVTSHELRTPVAIAEGSLSNLTIMFERHTEEKKLKEAAKTAHEQIIYLASMINDLSTLSRAERGVGDAIEEINVNETLHTLFDRYTPEADKKGLHLNLDADSNLPSVNTSRLYLEEILQNFVTNAIKYTKEGSVTLGATTLEDGSIKFFVKDTGIGMSKHDVEHIFEKFYRSEDYRTRETSGTGLGLYVVRKLANKLNIKVDVQSRLDHGSEFSFIMKTAELSPDGVESKKLPKSDD
jgi:PAS domain S-box-containing protein